jgi:hypothetical protein
MTATCPWRTPLLALSALTLVSGISATANPALANPGTIDGFSCVQAGGNFYIGLDNLPAPSGNVAMNPANY